MSLFTSVASIVGGQKKMDTATSNAKNMAQAEQQRAQEEQQRLEGKYGTLTANELGREDSQFALEKDRQAEYQRRAGLTGEQLIGEEGGINQELVDNIRRRFGMSGEELFASEGELNRRIGQEALSNDPYAMLAPELELARTSVNAEANRRGVFSGQPEGGIRFEQLGRANVDLAVKAAAQRIAQRNALASSYLTLGSDARAAGGILAERNMTASERARTELQNFLQQQQGQSSTARNRVAGVGINAAALADQGISRGYGTQEDLYGFKAGQGAALAQSGFETLGKLSGDKFVPPNYTGKESSGSGGGGSSQGLSGLADLAGKAFMAQGGA